MGGVSVKAERRVSHGNQSGVRPFALNFGWFRSGGVSVKAEKLRGARGSDGARRSRGGGRRKPGQTRARRCFVRADLPESELGRSFSPRIALMALIKINAEIKRVVTEVSPFGERLSRACWWSSFLLKPSAKSV